MKKHYKMKHMHLKPFFPMVILAIFFLSACNNEEWDKHYNDETFDLPENSIADYVNGNSDLSTFSQMLKIAGYEDILGSSQTFTLWAPVNASLGDVDLSDTALVRNIVRTHLTRGLVSTSGVNEKNILTIGSKIVIFSNDGSGYYYGENEVTTPNVPLNNGLVHVINGYAPYLKSLWEFLLAEDGLDSLSTYLNSQSVKVFDPDNSIEVGVDEDGNRIFDSAFVTSNAVLNQLGRIDLEDSIYTTVFPDNDAWIEAYDKISGYYNFATNAATNDDNEDRQDKLTKATLVQDLFFRGILENPASLDSVVSTNRNVFYDTDSIFGEAEFTETSNGSAYVTSKAPYADTTSWFQEIRVEAEYSDGRTNENSDIYTRYSLGTDFDLSNDRYILVEPSGASPKVFFSVPNVLSAKYNIYCVFVPDTIVNNNPLPSKATFRLKYILRSSGSAVTRNVSVSNNVIDANKVTKMFITEWTFNYANVIDEDFDEVFTGLEVTNSVTTAEESAGEFTSTMRIDCIIFEPVLE